WGWRQTRPVRRRSIASHRASGVPPRCIEQVAPWLVGFFFCAYDLVLELRLRPRRLAAIIVFVDEKRERRLHVEVETTHERDGDAERRRVPAGARDRRVGRATEAATALDDIDRRVASPRGL